MDTPRTAPKCNLYRLNQIGRAQGYHHTEGCRAGMYSLTRTAQTPKLIRAEQSGRATANVPTPKEEDKLNQDSDKTSQEHVAEIRDNNVVFGDVQADMVNPDYVALRDVLQILGVDIVSACGFASQITKKPPVSFLELYGRGRLNELAHGRRRNINCKGLGALDLRTRRPDGTPWIFLLKSHREDALAMVMMLKPNWVIGSPPCTARCSWNWHLNYKKMARNKIDTLISDGRTHLEFVLQIYRLQIAGGRYVLHEHPATAKSWEEDGMQELITRNDVFDVISHQCAYGLTSIGDDGQPRPVLKPTRWLSNSRHMIYRLSKRCKRHHEHHLLTDGRARAAEIHPAELCIEILRGMRDTEDANFHIDDDIALEHARWANALLNSAPATTTTSTTTTTTSNNQHTQHHDCHIDATDASHRVCGVESAGASNTVTLKHSNGTTSNISVSNWKPAYLDEYTREELPMDLAQHAMIDEITYFADNVIEIVDTSELKNYEDSKLLGGR